LSGAVNTVAPNRVTNAEFSKALGRALNRPAVLPVPALALKMLPGHMGQEMFLASARVMPEVLVKRSFGFQYPTLEHALQHTLQP
jgi:NAD dependent epimerase/dehydratase family enzyme